MNTFDDKYYVNVNKLMKNDMEEHRSPREYTSGVIERNQQDIDRETQELYQQVKPYLDQGYSLNKAVRTVKNVESVNTTLSWYRRLREYVEERV